MASQKKITFKVGVEDNASKKFAGLEKSLGGIKRMAKLTTVAITAIGASMGVAGVYSIKIAAQLEQERMAFKTLLGSIEEADKAIEMIKKDAASTPFELPGLMKANKLLTAVTKDATKSEKILLDVGKALSAMGKGQPELDRIIVNLQQVGAVGKASMMDVKQFAFAGIPIFEMLTETTGKTGEALQDMITDGDVSFDMLSKMFAEASGEGGRFETAFTDQAGTFNQLVSNMKDNFSVLGAEIVQQSGVFDLVKSNLAGVVEWTDAHKESIIEAVSHTGEWVDKFKALFGETTILGAFLRDTLEPIITDLRETFVSSWNDIKEAIEPIKPELEFLAKFFGVILLGALIVAIKAFAQFVKMVVGGVTFLIDSFATAWKVLEDGVTAVVMAMTGDFEGAWITIKEGAATMVNYVIRQINKLVKAINKVPGIDVKEIGNVDFRAEGGPVSQGSSYIVGERGPEMFVPNQSGTIVPNGGGGQSFNFNFSGATITNEEELVNKITLQINRQLETANMGLS